MRASIMAMHKQFKAEPDYREIGRKVLEEFVVAEEKRLAAYDDPILKDSFHSAQTQQTIQLLRTDRGLFSIGMDRGFALRLHNHPGYFSPQDAMLFGPDILQLLLSDEGMDAMNRSVVSGGIIRTMLSHYDFAKALGIVEELISDRQYYEQHRLEISHKISPN